MFKHHESVLRDVENAEGLGHKYALSVRAKAWNHKASSFLAKEAKNSVHFSS